MSTCEWTVHALFAGLFMQTHNLLPFPGLHWPFHWAEMILQRQHKRELCGPSKCAFRAGGVRRSGRWKVGWGGEKLMEGGVVLGEGEAKIDDKASVVLEQPWHYDIVDSQKYTLAHPEQRRVDPITSSTSARKWDLCFKPVVIATPGVSPRVASLKLLSQANTH